MSISPERIFEVGFSFLGSRTLLAAVETDLFTRLGDRALTADQLGEELGFHPRARRDFFDALVALGFLDREGDGPAGRYRNTPDGKAFLVEGSPDYVGGILQMASQRLYRFWSDLPDGLRTGRPQNEVKHSLKPLFEELYADLPRLEQFVAAMSGISKGNFRAFALKFDFGRYESLCDVGGASGLLTTLVAEAAPHMRLATFDLPAVEPIARRAIERAGKTGRIEVVSGDFFRDALPKADVITMGMILHDWGLEEKKHLIRLAYEALPPGGAFVAIENLIDDARRQNAFGLLMSLNMLIETPDGFDFSGADFQGWCREAGFSRFETIHLQGPCSAAVAYK